MHGERHVEMGVEIHCAAEVLHQCHDTDLLPRAGQLGIIDDMRGDRPIDDIRHAPHPR